MRKCLAVTSHAFAFLHHHGTFDGGSTKGKKVKTDKTNDFFNKFVVNAHTRIMATKSNQRELNMKIAIDDQMASNFKANVSKESCLAKSYAVSYCGVLLQSRVFKPRCKTKCSGSTLSLPSFNSLKNEWWCGGGSAAELVVVELGGSSQFLAGRTRGLQSFQI